MLSLLARAVAVAEAVTGWECLHEEQGVMEFHPSCSVLVQESQKHSITQVTDGNTKCLSALKHALHTCRCAPYRKVR